MKRWIIPVFLFLTSLAIGQTPNVTLTGTVQGPNGLPAANTVISLTPTQAFFVAGSGGLSTCSGYTLQINGLGVQCGTLNFNSAIPLAPVNGYNITFQKSQVGSITSLSGAFVVPDPMNFPGAGIFQAAVTAGASGLSGQQELYLTPDINNICAFYGQGQSLDSLSDQNGILYWNPGGSGGVCQQVFTVIPTPQNSIPGAGMGYFYTPGTGGFTLQYPGAQNNSAAPSWFGNWDGSNYTIGEGNQGIFTTTSAFTVLAYMVHFDVPRTINKLTFTTATWNSNPTVAVGLYDQNGNELIAWNNILVTTNATPVTVTPSVGGSQALPAGTYFWAFGASVTTGTTVQTEGGLINATSNENTMPWNHSTVRGGSAANPMSGAGVMPTTLGTLTAGFPNGNAPLPLWIIEP